MSTDLAAPPDHVTVSRLDLARAAGITPAVLDYWTGLKKGVGTRHDAFPLVFLRDLVDDGTLRPGGGRNIAGADGNGRIRIDTTRYDQLIRSLAAAGLLLRQGVTDHRFLARVGWEAAYHPSGTLLAAFTGPDDRIRVDVLTDPTRIVDHARSVGVCVTYLVLP